jgi:putative transposase
VVDGSTVRLPDTPENRRDYPVSTNQFSRPGFPILKVLTLFSLRSGALLARATGSLKTAETRLLMDLAGQIQPGDILTGDRAYGLFVMLQWTYSRGADLVPRVNCLSRRVDFRQRLQKLGSGDALFLWCKPNVPSKLLTPEQWTLVPPTLVVRIVRQRVHQKGFRTRELTWVTTLLDADLYPAQELFKCTSNGGAWKCVWMI